MQISSISAHFENMDKAEQASSRIKKMHPGVTTIRNRYVSSMSGAHAQGGRDGLMSAPVSLYGAPFVNSSVTYDYPASRYEPAQSEEVLMSVSAKPHTIHGIYNIIINHGGYDVRYSSI